VRAALLAEEPLVRWDWVRDHQDEIVTRFWQHVTLTVVAVGIGFVLAMAMALVSVRWRRAYPAFTGVSGVLYAIPSLALFGILIPFYGLGFRTAEVALVSYTLLILLRNIVAGIDGVPEAVREAADGMGYEGWRRLVSVDLPLALPTIVAGLRIATVTTVGLVTIAALVSAGGLGTFIDDGLGRDFPTPIVVGAVLSVLLAITFDLFFVGVEWLLTPWARAGRRQARGRAS